MFSLTDSSNVPAIVVSSAPLTPPSLSLPVVSSASPAVPNVEPAASAASPAAASTGNPAPSAAPTAAAAPASTPAAPASKPSAGTNNPEEAARALAEKRRQAREQREREEQERLEQEHKNRSVTCQYEYQSVVGALSTQHLFIHHILSSNMYKLCVGLFVSFAVLSCMKLNVIFTAKRQNIKNNTLTI